MRKYFHKTVVLAVLALLGLAVAGCESTNARPASLTGDDQAPTHERHSTGIESQARDM